MWIQLTVTAMPPRESDEDVKARFATPTKIWLNLSQASTINFGPDDVRIGVPGGISVMTFLVSGSDDIATLRRYLESQAIRPEDPPRVAEVY